MRVYKVKFNGQYVVTPHLQDALSIIESEIIEENKELEEGEQLEIELLVTDITEEEYAALGEFDGW